MARTEGFEGRLIDIDTGALRKGHVLLQRSKDAYFCIGFGPRPAGVCGFAFEDAGGADPFIAQCRRVAASIENDELAKAQRSSAPLSRTEIQHKPLHRLAVAEALAKSGFNPEELRDWHGRWAREGGGDFLAPLNAGVKPASADRSSEGSAPLRLPPGERIDELGDLLEWIANSKPEDAPAIRGEIKRLYYDVGDTNGGDALNRALSDAMESPKLIDRKAILETYERYTREDPVEIGQVMRDAVSSILVFPSSALLPREVPPPPIPREGLPTPSGATTPTVVLPSYLTRLADVWKLGWAARGWAVEEALGSNLPRWFPTIDKFADGVVTSIKSIDLSAAVYGDAGRLSARIDAYVDKVAGFNGTTRSSITIDAQDIQGRALHLAIPADGGTVVQRAAIEASAARAKTLGVNVIITKF